jgi:hypothetical protein
MLSSNSLAAGPANDLRTRNPMDWKILRQRPWLNLLGALILAAGLGSAAWIYQRAHHTSPGGANYALNPEYSKMYRHNLEVYGGQFSVIMDDLRRGFLGLWQGKSLAVIIGAATILVAAGFFYKANIRRDS